jgi:uncharacterized membrane protein
MANKTQNATATTTFSIKEAFSYGWKTFKKRPGFFIVFSLIIIGVNIIPSILNVILSNEELHLEALSFIVSFLGIVLALTVSLGARNFALKIYDNKPTFYSSIFEKWRLAFKFFLANILYNLIIFAGLILLIIPGIIWSIKFQFYPYIMVDRGAGIIESLKLSSEITNNNKWKLFLFGFAKGLVSILGFLLLGIGILAAIPIAIMAETYVYRKLSAGK